MENVVKQVKIAEDRLVIEKLEKGVYTLNLLKIGKRLTLKVIEGEHWNNPNKVLNDGGS